jgi:stearoyl-CoA desaturase (delta-9 desaturase)
MYELIYLLVCTHITIACVTLYLHRSQAHRSMSFHPMLSHFMRCWLWLTTGMVTKEWVAVHRLHHRYCDKEKDPHSPVHYGILTVLFKGALLYNNAAKNREMVDTYGIGTPDDWIENNVYSKYAYLGILIMLYIDITLFGFIGFGIWLCQMVWIPFWAAGVVNGVGHYWGYRNGDTRDESRNISPIDFLVGGELLHNNHHVDPSNPKLSIKWFEFDIGWMYFKIFNFLGLASNDKNKK